MHIDSHPHRRNAFKMLFTFSTKMKKVFILISVPCFLEAMIISSLSEQFLKCKLYEKNIIMIKLVYI